MFEKTSVGEFMRAFQHAGGYNDTCTSACVEFVSAHGLEILSVSAALLGRFVTLCAPEVFEAFLDVLRQPSLNGQHRERILVELSSMTDSYHPYQKSCAERALKILALVEEAMQTLTDSLRILKNAAGNANSPLYSALMLSASSALFAVLPMQLLSDLIQTYVIKRDNRLELRGDTELDKKRASCLLRVCQDVLRIYYGVDIAADDLLLTSRPQLQTEQFQSICSAIGQTNAKFQMVRALQVARIQQPLWPIYVRSEIAQHILETGMLQTSDTFLKLLPKLLDEATVQAPTRSQRL